MGILWFGRKDRVLACRDAGFDCDAMFNSRSDRDIMEQAAAHMTLHHRFASTPELRDRLRAIIKRVPGTYP